MNRGLWTRETVVVLLLAAYLPLALFWLWFGGINDLQRFALALLVIAVWQLVFLLARAQPISLSAAITALGIAMLAPEELGAVRLILGISFGTVMGELVFGGWGRNVVNPATVTLAFLGFGFPAYAWPEILVPVAWAAIPAAVIGVMAGVMPAGLVLGATIGAAVSFGFGVLPATALPAAGVVLVLAVADPVTSASTALGRWLNGLLFIALVVLFATGWQGAAPVQIAVAAALLASLAAPLLDELALAHWYAQRRRRHGRY